MITDEQLQRRVVELLETGKGQTSGDTTLLPIVELDSGRVLGLDEELRWVVDDGDAAQVFESGAERHFFEVVESKRNDFEERLAQSAAELELPADPLVWGFPATQLVAAALKTESVLYTRLGLLWLLPTELREMREAILAVSRIVGLPGAIRQLADRLVVPE